MATGGLSAARLRRMHDVLAGHVDNGELPGMITLVSRHGDVHVDVIGTLAMGGTAQMERDTIFRVASMTKPIVAAAAMILVEECRLGLDEPVDGLLPELADRRVLTSLESQLDDTVPANRSITLRDLLTFRLGIGQLMAPPDKYPILAAATEQKVITGPPDPTSMLPADEWLRRLGELPLMYQPGERWLYNTGSDILGVLIARATDQSLEDFLRDRIFEPLGMVDTAFSLPAKDVDRLATSYMPNQQTGELEVFDTQNGMWAAPPPFQSGAGGLVSTVDDYLAFGTMMLNQGRYRTRRILSRPSVAAMTTDQLTQAQKAVSGFLPGYFDNLGWGFGVSVVTGRDTPYATPGRYGWDGGLGTTWATDPAEDLVAVLLTQRAGFPLVSKVYQDFWTSVYAAIDD
ncbi:MAG TPA: serine hydrolase domain-containing protein [Pseudonocardiaceae bacterium]|nr:serine hydrolase domain-containing protein [Pseudonocardiaceae bacterium]